MTDPPFPAALDAFLDHPPSAPPPRTQRAELLRQTAAEIRRRRWRVLMRRYVTAAALVLLTVALVLAHGVSRTYMPIPSLQPIAKQRHEPPVEPAPSVPAPKPPASPAAQSAVALEWQAFDAPDAKQPALYLAAGNRYVEDERDLGSAVRCYGQALHAAPTVDVDANDNWLVLALKMDEIERRREK